MARTQNLIPFIFLSILSLLLYFRGVFSAALNVFEVDPIIIVKPEAFKFYSLTPIYVRGTSLTITYGRITSITVTVFNSGTSIANTTVIVYVYDDGGNLIGSGRTIAILSPGTTLVGISIDPQPQYSAAHKIEVSV